MKLCMLTLCVLLAWLSCPAIVHGYQADQPKPPFQLLLNEAVQTAQGICRLESCPEAENEVVHVTQGPTAAAPRQVQPGLEPGTVDTEWFASVMQELPAGVHLVDVRPENAFEKAHIQGSVNMPALEALGQDCEALSPRLPREGTIIFICTAGKFSRAMYNKMLNSCEYPETDRIYYLNAEIDYEAGTLDISME